MYPSLNRTSGVNRKMVTYVQRPRVSPHELPVLGRRPVLPNPLPAVGWVGRSARVAGGGGRRGSVRRTGCLVPGRVRHFVNLGHDGLRCRQQDVFHGLERVHDASLHLRIRCKKTRKIEFTKKVTDITRHKKKQECSTSSTISYQKSMFFLTIEVLSRHAGFTKSKTKWMKNEVTHRRRTS